MLNWSCSTGYGGCCFLICLFFTPLIYPSIISVDYLTMLFTETPLPRDLFWSFIGTILSHPNFKNICIYTEFIHSQNNSFLYVCTSTLYTHKYIHQLNHPLLLPAAPPSCLLPWPAFTFLTQVCLPPRLMNPVQRFSN